MEVNRQRFALNLGLAIMAFHIAFAVVIWFVITFPHEEQLAVKEMAAPVTIGYAVAVLKYYLDTGGRITLPETIGIRLAILVIGIMGSFAVALVAAPLVYLNSSVMTPEVLNGIFVAVESAFGALLALIFSYLYKVP